jgi:GDP-L-fucose synthase
VELRDTRTIVTGGTGFLGGNVAAALAEAGAAVQALGSADFDLRSRAEIDRMLDELRPELVVHLAAVVGGIGANRAEPGRFLYENALMGIELLEAARIHGVAKVCVAGTVCEYPKFTPVPFREDDLWNGYPEETNAPYGIAKKLLLVQGQAYRQQYEMNVIHVLPVNLYGPGDNFDLETGHVIPSIIRKCLDARDSRADEITLWGDGSATREFLFARDAGRGFRLAVERYDDPEPVNLGSASEISIRELATTISELTGFAGELVWDTSQPNGQPRRMLDTSRAANRFGFHAKVGLREGLAETIEWYEKVRASEQ